MGGMNVAGGASISAVPPPLSNSGQPSFLMPAKANARDFFKLDDDVVESLPDSYLRWMDGIEKDGQWWVWADLPQGMKQGHVMVGISKNKRVTKRSRPSSLSAAGQWSGFAAQPRLLDSRFRDSQHLDGLAQTDGASLDVYVDLLKKCGNSKALAEGRRVHAHILRCRRGGERFLANLLIEMYGKCGSVEDARAVFDTISKRNLYSWNIMLAAYAQNGHEAEGLLLFEQMRREGLRPDKFTFSTIISACSNVRALEEGKAIHAIVRKSGLDTETVVGTALVNMYGKCCSLEDARRVFENMQERDEITWNAMIAAYAQDGYGKEALQLYQRMQQEGVMAGCATFVSVLDACASMSALALGRMIHNNLALDGLDSDVIVGTALVNMYAKCGMIVEARNTFDRMQKTDVVAWTAMLAAYAKHGHVAESKEIMKCMEVEGVIPNSVTFLSLIFACSHVGLLYEARNYFLSMAEHGIRPIQEHYRCLIDLLGRGGRLQEAEELINNMPFEPEGSTWLAMLSACRLQGDLERAEHAAQQCYDLESKRPSAYVLMCNMYAAAGKWDDVEKVRNLMEIRGVKKDLGLSSIEVKNRIHEFCAADKSQRQTKAIYDELQRLTIKMKEAGYVPDTRVVLHDVDEDMKERMVSSHSEKLAIAFGLINTAPGESICIVNNLRVCSDCHTAIKFISTIARRDITVRDTNRFHRFSNGACTCGDYW